MNPGFWHTNYWPLNYWAEDYWPDWASVSELLKWPIKAFKAYSGTRAFMATRDGLFRAMKTLGFKIK